MNISSRSAELLSHYAEALAAIGFPGWTRIVVYKELRRTPDGYLQNIAMEECWIGEQRLLEMNGSVEATDALERFFDHCTSHGNAWSGLRLELVSTGSYTSVFYHDTYPLLDGDYETAELRIAAPDVA